MSSDHTDVGGLTQRLSEIFYDQVLGDVSISVNEQSLSRSEDQLNEKPKNGDCYIFDYQVYQGHTNSRPGSEKDVARLTHVFKALDFDIYNDFLDLSKKDTLNELKKAAAKDHTQSKYFVCCFLTHGDSGVLLMNDKYINIDEILKCFSGSSCKSLIGKPKIFIFQACRGKCCEEGVPCDSTDFDPGLLADIPDYLNFLLVYSTYDGKMSFKTKDELRIENNHGSFFIDELCRTFEQFSVDSDLLQILTITNYRVAHFYLSCTKEEKTHKKKQMPCFKSRLTSEVKFNKAISMFKSDDTVYFDIRRKSSSSGKKSPENPLQDRKIYKIQKSKIKFLFLLNTKNNFESQWPVHASNLWSSVAERSYEKVPLEDWSKKKLMMFLKKVSAQGCSNTDCLICFIACQAKGDYLFDNNGNKFLMREIVEQFNGQVCEDLREKPKIFIFLTSSLTKKAWFPYVSADSTDCDDYNLIPVHSDILEVAITIQGAEQLKAVVEKFCTIFGKESSEDFLSQLTRMNNELVNASSNKNLLTLSFNSTLTETLILNNP